MNVYKVDGSRELPLAVVSNIAISLSMHHVMLVLMQNQMRADFIIFPLRQLPPSRLHALFFKISVFEPKTEVSTHIMLLLPFFFVFGI